MQQADRGGSGQQGGQAQQRRQDHQRVADHHAAVGPQRPSQVAQGGAGDHAQRDARRSRPAARRPPPSAAPLPPWQAPSTTATVRAAVSASWPTGRARGC
ncbi:hypothetical protein G6F62_015103 [Rhizopus arrhizus]|nr:hypothetical protein G6F62_015103 [Rhizopus arrhizus]